MPESPKATDVIESLKRGVLEKHPTANFEIDGPTQGLWWFVDIMVNDRQAVLEHREKDRLIGVTDCSEPDGHFYGEGPDQVYTEDEFEKALGKLLEILSSH